MYPGLASRLEMPGYNAAAAQGPGHDAAALIDSMAQGVQYFAVPLV